MESDGGLVQQDELGPGAGLQQHPPQLEPLHLTAGERAERLTQAQVAEPEPGQELQLAPHRRRRVVAEEFERLIHRLVQHADDVQTPVAVRARLGGKARAVARLAQDLFVGEKLHVQHRGSPAAAQGAASAVGVQRKVAGRQAVEPGLGQVGEQRPDGVEYLQEGRRV